MAEEVISPILNYFGSRRQLLECETVAGLRSETVVRHCRRHTARPASHTHRPGRSAPTLQPALTSRLARSLP